MFELIRCQCEENYPCYYEDRDAWVIECPYCGIRAVGKTKREAMEAWNDIVNTTDSAPPAAER